jgi:hypothetical protein
MKLMSWYTFYIDNHMSTCEKVYQKIEEKGSLFCAPFLRHCLIGDQAVVLTFGFLKLNGQHGNVSMDLFKI